MKSFLAILAGLIFTVVVTGVVDLILLYTDFFPVNPKVAPPVYVWIVATAYRLVFAIAGCWIAARLAPSRPMLHALILGGIGMAIAILGAIINWNDGPAYGPHWYPVLLVVTALPCAWIGGFLRASQSAATPVSN
jgi:hypothetical protein